MEDKKEAAMPTRSEFDKFIVRVNREIPAGAGSSVVKSLLLVSLEATLNLTQKEVDDANAFEIAHTGVRLYPAGQHKAGDTITVNAEEKASETPAAAAPSDAPTPEPPIV